MKNRMLTARFGPALCAFAVVSLTGCHRQFSDPTKLQSTADSHRTTFSNSEGIHFTSYGSGSASPSGLDDGGVEIYTDDTGRKVPKSYYIIYCDIYWRLNWIRLELKKGNVPEQFGRKLTNVRNELKEATNGIPHDGNYRVADEALTYLETGWTHYQAAEDITAAGAQVSSAPWTVGALAMQQYIDSGGLGFGTKSLANLPIAPTGGAGSDPALASGGDPLSMGATDRLTPRQERAIAVAVRYAGDFHRSPRDCAREDWSRAVEKINKLRDQLWMMNKGNNKDSSSIVDIGPNTGSNATSNDSEHITNGYMKNGTDLPTASAPLGDPFTTPPPMSSMPASTPRRGGE